MSSSSSNGVDERLNKAFEEMFDQQFDHTFDSIVDVQANKPKRQAYIERDREQGHNLLWNDYFREHPTYPSEMFRRRFQMNKPLFLRIVDRLSNEVPYFEQRKNAHGRYELSALQKCTAAIRMLAYGQSGDTPTPDDLQRLLDVGEVRGFPGMIGRIDCMHWEWKNCPTAWRGQYTRGSGTGQIFTGQVDNLTVQIADLEKLFFE
ncbi:PREDICTED: uncharacterized protein LOC106303127 [Brassica oleracea var. oleracea]|uniref:uncharacterized protein LOC106303127 n=1 Tax=Brassica oleracea var. oleracea TaxID=109376 RepID=UPI0006A755C7|nr:PREDICTED: uncharacterized protein LOC106303127 [Brassica oleracea var. oleracea]